MGNQDFVATAEQFRAFQRAGAWSPGLRIWGGVVGTGSGAFMEDVGSRT
jgi:hypothetical protein